MNIDGKNIANKIKQELKVEVEKKALKLKLVVIIVGDDEASKIYVRNKARACKFIGVESEIRSYPSGISEKELLYIIDELNKDSEVNGILVQLPLPKHINADKVILSIDPDKDVDGFHPINAGRLLLGLPGIQPCTPKGILYLLDEIGIELKGKDIVVIGRSNIVGKPISNMLINKGATVSILNSNTKNIAQYTKNADILIVAVGKAKFINSNYIKKDSIVIDVGINRLDDNTLCGDVDYDDVKNIVSYITPVPGGVGPMTIAMLMKNLVDTAK